MQLARLLKTVLIKDVDKQQTMLVLPPEYLDRYGAGSRNYSATFEQLAVDTMVLRLVSPHEQALNRPYKLVTASGTTWTSVPRAWLRGLGARRGDRVEVYSTEDSRALIVRYRKVNVFSNTV